MADLEELFARQQDWPVHWRWEGSSGHPRRLVDTLANSFREKGYRVVVAESDMRGGPLPNVGEFEGVLIAERQQSRKQAVSERWLYAVVGLLLIPVLIGFVLLVAAFQPRKFSIGLDWRGEVYTTGARGEIGQWSAERTGVISDVRMTMRGTQEFIGPVSRQTYLSSEQSNQPEFLQDITALALGVETMLPQLAASRTQRPNK